MSLQKPIQKLNPEVARKIAAGEVIDRPNAIVRELIDNAIDSGAGAHCCESGGCEDKILFHKFWLFYFIVFVFLFSFLSLFRGRFSSGL